MTIYATCGHKVGSVDDLTPVRYGDEDCDAIDGFQPCVVHAEFCPACAAKAETWPEFIRTEEEERDWFRKGAQYQRWRAAAE